MQIMKIQHINPIISGNDEVFNNFLRLAISSFFKELEGYIDHNSDPELLGYGNEATLMALFVNGLIRQDGNNYGITALQEYSTTRKSNNANGRLDAFIRHDKTGIWIEAKYDRGGALIKDRSSHWDIEKWLWWDKIEIMKQVTDYYEAEAPKVNSSYESHYVMTLAFKKLTEQPAAFSEEAEKELGGSVNIKHERSWYYSVGFLEYPEKEPTGLEVYGTFEKMK